MTSQHGLLRKLNFLLLPLLSSSLVSLVYAQNHASTLLPAASGSFPSCAVDCSRLHQAETNCVASTGSETTNQKDAVSCFCASGLLSQLHHSPNGTCDDTCADTSDRQLLQTWFANYCSSGDENVRRNTNAASEGSLDSNPSTFTTHKLMARDGSPTWWSTHYQWIVMVIVLIIGFTILTILAVWLKRRHDAKYPHLYHASSRASSGPLLSRNQPSSPSLTQPGSFDPNVGMAMTEPRRMPGANTDSYASSAGTAMSSNPQSFRSPTRLPRTAQPAGDGNAGIREV